MLLPYVPDLKSASEKRIHSKIEDNFAIAFAADISANVFGCQKNAILDKKRISLGKSNTSKTIKVSFSTYFLQAVDSCVTPVKLIAALERVAKAAAEKMQNSNKIRDRKKDLHLLTDIPETLPSARTNNRQVFEDYISSRHMAAVMFHDYCVDKNQIEERQVNLSMSVNTCKS